MTVFPILDSNGLPSWIRADLRAMPQVPTASAVGVGVRSRRPNPDCLTAAVALAICIALLLPAIRGGRG